MLVKNIFKREVTRDIPPVVYFHEQSPKQLEAEVSEYIITGGYPKESASYTKDGIHEELVHLLGELTSGLEEKDGAKNPAIWVSGFYGSGKSSFAKLLGLALEPECRLTNGRTLAEALVARDESPKGSELRAAWERLARSCKPLSVVFDVGTVALDGEHIHSVALKEVQKKLGYCSTSALVAQYELRLQRDSEWDAFLDVANATLGKPWDQVRHTHQADDLFSSVLHRMKPDQFPDPTAWIISAASREDLVRVSPAQVVDAFDYILEHRYPRRTLFLVIDEVSQYVHNDTQRMQRLQSFVEALGQRLKGKAWLIATGQQKLDEDGASKELIKLRDRFPPKLRVHLSSANIRDVVHQRLLKKDPAQEQALRDLFTLHRPNLSLYGYSCHGIGENDFVEVYPMLPGQVDLLMEIATNLRTSSRRAQGDSHAIRGLLQLLGELFREKKLAERPLGALVTLDDIYDVQQSALSHDMQESLRGLLKKCDEHQQPDAARAAKAIALLQLLPEHTKTDLQLIASCLYPRLGAPPEHAALQAGLDFLMAQHLVTYSEKRGYRIESSAGIEWARDRDDYRVGLDKVGEVLSQVLGALMGNVERPKLGNMRIQWLGLYSDAHGHEDQRVKDTREPIVLTVDFRFFTGAERSQEHWVPYSNQRSDRLLWVVGEEDVLVETARRLIRSKRMVERHSALRETLAPGKLGALVNETHELDNLNNQLLRVVAEAFLAGHFYFQGGRDAARDKGSTFAQALDGMGAHVARRLYPSPVDISVNEKELEQLLTPGDLSGVSTKFMEKELGLLSLDGNRYEVTCDGQVPAAIRKFIKDSGGASGSTLLSHFGKPPHGYSPDVLRASLAALLRGGFVSVQPEGGDTLTAVSDPGARDIFLKDRDFRKADFVLNTKDPLGGRERNLICNLFQRYFQLNVDRDNDKIANAVHTACTLGRERLRDAEARFQRLGRSISYPKKLDELAQAFEKCRSSRLREQTLSNVKRYLDVLTDGLAELDRCHSELTDDAVATLSRAHDTARVHAPQLLELGADGDVSAAARAIEEHFKLPRPWQELGKLTPHVEHILSTYRDTRRKLLGEQEQAVEDAIASVRLRDGFDLLDDDQRQSVLRPLRSDVRFETDDSALAPTLQMLVELFPSRLAKALALALERLDQLRTDRGGQPVHALRLDYHGREITSEAELKAWLYELEERIRAQLKQNHRVRLL